MLQYSRRSLVLAVTAYLMLPRLPAWGAQLSKLPRVALVYNAIPEAEMVGEEPISRYTRELIAALRDAGLVDGRDIVLERRSAEGHAERLPRIMQEVACSNVDVIVTTNVDVPAEFDAAFASIARQRAVALFVPAVPLNYSHLRRIADEALRQRLPSICPVREFADVGSRGPQVNPVGGKVGIGWVPRIATREVFGTTSLRSSKRLAASSGVSFWMPVTLPPGCARLWTIPAATMSSEHAATTIGIVVVARIAAVSGAPHVDPEDVDLEREKLRDKFG